MTIQSVAASNRTVHQTNIATTNPTETERRALETTSAPRLILGWHTQIIFAHWEHAMTLRIQITKSFDAVRGPAQSLRERAERRHLVQIAARLAREKAEPQPTASEIYVRLRCSPAQHHRVEGATCDPCEVRYGS